MISSLACNQSLRVFNHIEIEFKKLNGIISPLLGKRKNVAFKITLASLSNFCIDLLLTAVFVLGKLANISWQPLKKICQKTISGAGNIARICIQNFAENESNF